VSKAQFRSVITALLRFEAPSANIHYTLRFEAPSAIHYIHPIRTRQRQHVSLRFTQQSCQSLSTIVLVPSPSSQRRTPSSQRQTFCLQQPTLYTLPFIQRYASFTQWHPVLPRFTSLAKLPFSSLSHVSFAQPRSIGFRQGMCKSALGSPFVSTQDPLAKIVGTRQHSGRQRQ